ncbi:MAG: protein translocase subunit SecF [Oscillospiraceae bacterium]|jgi:preprotein translocase SecF subunit|nr:protein translocase subunit SecF [Oscillospiraceae bacterium]
MPKINFVGNLKKFTLISAILIIAIIVFSFVFGVNLDIQFRGGSIITYSYEGDLDMPAFEQTVNGAVGTSVSLQKSENIATGQQTVVVSLPGTQSLSSEQMNTLSDTVQGTFAQNNLQTMEISNVDPTIGSEFLAKCLVAVAFASLLMVIYVAFRFRKIGGLSAGVIAVVALIHDVVIVYGVFIIFRIPINDNFMAVILTILGYSLNDTIVIYDRIRENERMQSRNAQIGELVNLSINQSFKRTLMTSITTVLAMVVVTVVAVIFNVDTIISFSFPLIIGLISGSYSSICLAGPLWVKWQENKQSKASA